MKTVGLTGGIGSGKTTVANFFKELGVPVFIADSEAKFLMENSPDVRSRIIQEFGSQSYEADKPNRKYLASVVFQNQKKLDLLNGIIHPAVAKRFAEWKKKQSAPYIIYEAAILFEMGRNKDCDFVILVTAPKNVRLERVAARDQANINEIEARMDKQWSDERKARLADLILENIDLEELKAKVEKIHQHLLQLA